MDIKELQSTQDITTSFIKEFGLPPDSNSRARTQKKIAACCKKIKPIGNGFQNLWEETALTYTSKEKSGEYTRHIFSDLQVQKLYECIDLFKYLYKNFPEAKRRGDIKKYMDNIVSAKEQNELEESYIPSQDSFDEFGFSCTLAEIQQKKHEIMLEAIFIHFFGLFNEDQLKYDMEMCSFVAGTNMHNAESEACRKRLYNPHSHNKYYDNIKIKSHLNKGNGNHG